MFWFHGEKWQETHGFAIQSDMKIWCFPWFLVHQERLCWAFSRLPKILHGGVELWNLPKKRSLLDLGTHETSLCFEEELDVGDPPHPSTPLFFRGTGFSPKNPERAPEAHARHCQWAAGGLPKAWCRWDWRASDFGEILPATFIVCKTPPFIDIYT